MAAEARARGRGGIARTLLLAPALAVVFLGWLSAGERPSLDAVVERAMAEGLVAGAVVVAGDRDDVRVARTYGKAWEGEGAPALPEDAVFDTASLTKVVATAPVVVALADEGLLGLTDPVARWLPELGTEDKRSLQVVHLLTHTSGLADLPEVPTHEPLAGALRAAADRRLATAPGSRFRYLDINFLLLGEIARRATGDDLDRLARERVFAPLGLEDTSFRPAPEQRARCVPTRGVGGVPYRGEAQDPWARALGGVAGNSGVFSTGRDLAAYCRALLGDGRLGGRRFLRPEAVRLMTAGRPVAGGEVLRGLGWDVRSPFSSPRGDVFSDDSFGHTGYSGCSLWLDPGVGRFVVLLTPRLDYRRVADFNRFRAEVSNAAGELLSLGRRTPAGVPAGG